MSTSAGSGGGGSAPKPKPKPAWNPPQPRQHSSGGSSGGSANAADHAQTGNDLMSLIHEAGFQGSAAQTMYAIVMAESGGNANAHNTNAGTGDNSYGLAQINMLGSMGPERLREYGLSSATDLFDPLTNLRVAYKMSGGGTHFGDWSTFNRGDYLKYMGQSGAKVSGSAQGGAAGGDSSTYSSTPTNLSGSDYKAALGSLSGLLSGVPELKSLLARAVAQHMPITDFTNAVQNSDWYRHHGDTYRQVIATYYSNPAEYQHQFGQLEQTIRAQAQSMGVHLNSQELNSLTHNALFSGTDTSTLQRQIAALYVRGGGANGVQSGTAASATQSLHQLAQQYGVPVTQSWVNSYATGILAGTQTLDGAKDALAHQAASTYPSIAKELLAGQTTHDVAQPYIAQMSQTLEIPDQTIQLTDPTIKRALSYRPPTTGGQPAAPQMMTLSDFENGLRSDPRWNNTNNAKQEAYSMLHQLGQSFGFDT